MNDKNQNPSPADLQASLQAKAEEKTPLSQPAIDKALAIPDLSDAGAPQPHAVARIVEAVIGGMSRCGWPRAEVVRGPRVVEARDNYALLGYDPGEITLGSEHTRWVSQTRLLRTQTTSLIPQALKEAAARRKPGERVMIAAPGITYRRDVRDRWHCAEPHQMDLWMLCDAQEATDALLRRWVAAAVECAVPGAVWDMRESPHHYTEGGQELQIQLPRCMRQSGRRAGAPQSPTPLESVEALECGRIARSLLDRLGIDSSVHGGLALGMGLDRMAMLRKGIPDIRLLRDPDPRIARQMLDLQPWRAVSKQPATSRDISLALWPGQSEETLTEKLLGAAGEQASWVESMAVVQRWSEAQLPPQALQRLGMRPGQENALLRVELRDWSRSIPRAEANALYARLQEALHEGVDGGGYKL